MERKIICFLLLSLLAFGKTFAYEKSDTTTTPVPLIIKGPGGENGDYHRSHSSSIMIYQNGCLLDFGPPYSGCSVVLINVDELTVYSTVVSSDGIVVFPEYLDGVFELRLMVDNDIYSGVIFLEYQQNN